MPADLNAEGIRLQQRAADLLKRGDYDQLESEARQLRVSKSRLQNGAWKFAIFLDGLVSGAGGPPSDARREHLTRLEEWRKARPKSALPLIAMARTYDRYAWQARGNGYAATVSGKGWEEFKSYIEKAVKCLEQAEQIDASNPAVYSTEVDVYRSASLPKEAMDSFKRGVEVEPLYTQLYSQMAWLLLPRWYGRPGDLENFAAYAADNTAAQEGDAMYARIALIAMDAEDSEIKTKHRFVWDRVKQGFNDLDKHYPGSQFNLNRFARFCCLMDDRAAAKYYFGRIDPEWKAADGSSEKRGVWKSEGEYRKWRDWANGQAGLPLGMPIHQAAIRGDIDEAERQLKAGIKIDVKDPEGSTPLLLACLHRHEELAKLLIDRGAGVNAASKNGVTPLHAAAMKGLLKTAQVLIERGADPTAAEKKAAWTPLHYAAADGHGELILLLLLQCKGVDVNDRDRSGDTALHWAASRGHTGVIMILLGQKGVEVNPRDNRGNTPLHLAALRGDHVTVQFLLVQGADPRLKNDEDKTALDLARERDRDEAVKVLEKIATSKPARN